MAQYRPRLEEVRAHNRAQNPAKDVHIRHMGTDRQCGAAYAACLEAVQARAKACRPAPDNTYDHCFLADRRESLDCANQEIDCCERALEAKCRNQ